MELAQYWTAAFKNYDLQTLRSLLQGMEGLVLIIYLNGMYRLRTPNITKLLGGESDILLRLCSLETVKNTESNDPNEVRNEVADIFVASQYNLLADTTSRLCWISGAAPMGLDLVPECLNAIVEKHKMENPGQPLECRRIKGVSVVDAMSSLAESSRDVKSGGLENVVN